MHKPGCINKALILAAGTGSRLQPLTNQTPKCLTQVGDSTILYQLISHLRSVDIRHLVVVIGHKGEQIQRYIETHAPDFSVQWVFNPQYASTNNIYSLWLARHLLNEAFILLESDLVFDRTQFAGLLLPDRIAISKTQSWMNGSHVELDDSGIVKRYLSGSALLQKRQTEIYKTVNIYSFSEITWQRIQKHLHVKIQSGQLNDYYETVFADLILQHKLKLAGVMFDPDRWYEIDTLEDLQAAEDRMGDLIVPPIHSIDYMTTNSLAPLARLPDKPSNAELDTANLEASQWK